MSDVVLVGMVTAFAGIIGAVIGVCGTFIITSRTARFEEQRHIREIASRERQHFRELGLKVALAKFEGCAKLAQQLANATGKFQEVPPFEAFVIDGVKFMEIVATPDLSADETARRMSELRGFSQFIIQAAKKRE
jgi:uncharacterized membrane protein YccC